MLSVEKSAICWNCYRLVSIRRIHRARLDVRLERKAANGWSDRITQYKREVLVTEALMGCIWKLHGTALRQVPFGSSQLLHEHFCHQLVTLESTVLQPYSVIMLWSVNHKPPHARFPRPKVNYALFKLDWKLSRLIMQQPIKHGHLFSRTLRCQLQSFNWHVSCKVQFTLFTPITKQRTLSICYKAPSNVTSKTWGAVLRKWCCIISVNLCANLCVVESSAYLSRFWRLLLCCFVTMGARTHHPT